METTSLYTIPGVRAQASVFRATSSAPPSAEDDKVVTTLFDSPEEARAALLSLDGLTPAEETRRVTIWNRVEQRKIAGTAAPLRRNLGKFLLRNPQCDIFIGQTQISLTTPGAADPLTGRLLTETQRVPLWNTLKQCKITGNACPLAKNLAFYLARNPGIEIYHGQDLLLAQAKASNQTVCQRQPHISQDTTFEMDLESDETEGNTLTLIDDGSNPMTDSRFPVHVFQNTHQIVPINYWQEARGEDYASLADFTSANLADSASSTMLENVGSTHPSSDDDPKDIMTVDFESKRDEDAPDRELASSWSDTPMWTDPNHLVHPESHENLIAATLEEMSLSFDTGDRDVLPDLRNWTTEEGVDCSSLENLSGNAADEDDSSITDYFVKGDPE